MAVGMIPDQVASSMNYLSQNFRILLLHFSR